MKTRLTLKAETRKSGRVDGLDVPNAETFRTTRRPKATSVSFDSVVLFSIIENRPWTHPRAATCH